MNITIELVVAAVSILGAVAGVWWRVEGMIRKNTDSIAEHRLHVAETYITKTSMREVTDQIMEAIGGIGAQITEMRGRIDRVFEKPPAPRRQ